MNVTRSLASNVQYLMRAALGILFLASLAFAEIQMSVEQLRGFVTSSRKLGHTDKQIADYLKNIKVTERLEPGVVEDLTGTAGPKTMEVLRRLSETSKTLPAPPPPAPRPVVVSIPPPSSAEQGRILDHVRDYALDYSRNLPNFICTQVTRRYADPSGLEFWQQQDTITSKLSYFEQREKYQVMLVNNHYVDTTMERLGGATSTGEFGSMLKQVFDLRTRATFEWARWATLRGHRMYVFAYSVPQETSQWRIVYERSDSITPAYGGLVYVDRETNAVMRITLEARDIPPTFPVQQAGTVLDYDYQDISGNTYLLPLKSVVRMRSGKLLTRNDTEFRHYNKFGAEATITFTPDAIPEDQLKEQTDKPQAEKTQTGKQK